MHNDPPTVFVVDHDDVVRGSLESLIQGAGWQPEVFASAAAFLARPRHAGVSCLVLDAGLPGLDGIDLQELIAGWKHLPVIFVSAQKDVGTCVRAMKSGAIEFLAKPLSIEALLGAIRHGLDLSRSTLEKEQRLQALRSLLATLSAREREVMTLVVSGLLNKQVSAMLGISEITVKAHRGAAMRKMRARSFAELVIMAVTLRIVDASLACPPIRPARDHAFVRVIPLSNTVPTTRAH